jgi:hypothetical protein
MRKLLLTLWTDDCGAVMAAEWVFVASIMVLGAATCLVAARQALVSDLAEWADKVTRLHQSGSYDGRENVK